MGKRAVILAGGKGTRLRPYTIVFPKPLVPVGEYPILEIVIRQLAEHGFDHITMAVNHQANILKAFFGDGSNWGVNIDYSLENKPLSTMGPLKLIKDLPENFLIMNGDILTDLNYGQLFEEHSKRGTLFTISSYKREEKIDYGVLNVKNEMLTGFQEKPKVNFEVSMGIYIANREILKYIPENQSYGFDNLMNDLLNAKKTINVRTFDQIWLDIGRPSDYEKAIEIFQSNETKFFKKNLQRE